jgi:hypothetical protein
LRSIASNSAFDTRSSGKPESTLLSASRLRMISGSVRPSVFAGFAARFPVSSSNASA